MAKKKSAQAPAGDVARKIWLAGIGAYGRAFSEAQESLAKLSDETSKHFDELVRRGEEIEDTVESRGREIAKRVRSNTASTMEERIKDMREKLQRGHVLSGDDDDRLDAIEARLAAVEAKLDALAKGGAKKPAKRKSAKRKTTKKKSA